TALCIWRVAQPDAPGPTLGRSAFMWVVGANGSLGRPRAELALLLLASSLVVLALGIAVTSGAGAAPAEWRATLLPPPPPPPRGPAGGGPGAAAARGVRAVRRGGGGPRPPRDETADRRKTVGRGEPIKKGGPRGGVGGERGRGGRVITPPPAGAGARPPRHSE